VTASDTGQGPGHDRGDDNDDEDGRDFLDEPTAQIEPPKPFAPAILAIDISGSKFGAGLVSTKGDLLDRASARIEPDVGPEAHFVRLATIVEQQMSLADRHEIRIAAVGIASAGPITTNCETVSPMSIPAWREFPLRERVRELTAKEVYGDGDGKALAMAEGWVGAAKGYSNYCVITVSTGVGGGIVLDGELLDGASGNAGHIGHIIVDPNGRRCSCGARGCLEAEASGTAIEAITGRSPNEPTYEIMQRTGRLVGRAAASLCNMLDLDLVAVGGGVALGFAATFFNAAQEELSSDARLPYSRQARITPTRLGDRGPLIGAGAIGIRGWQRDRAKAARRRVAESAQGEGRP
jgi:glucokinase